MRPSIFLFYSNHILLIQLYRIQIIFFIGLKHLWEKQGTAWSWIINVLIIMTLNICITLRPPRVSLGLIKVVSSANESTTNHAHTLFHIFTVAWSRATVIRITLIPYFHVGIYDLLKRVIRFEIFIRWLHTSHDLFDAFSNRQIWLICTSFFVVHGQCFSWNTVMRIWQLIVLAFLIGLRIEPLFSLVLPPVLDRLCFIVLV